MVRHKNTGYTQASFDLSVGAPEKPQEALEDPNEYKHTGEPPNGPQNGSQSLLWQSRIGPELPDGPLALVLARTGKPGAYGAMAVYNARYGHGVAFSQEVDLDRCIARVIENVEAAVEWPCVLGEIVDMRSREDIPTPELAMGDRRIIPLPKPKSEKKRSHKPNYQNQEWYGAREDRENWAKSLDLARGGQTDGDDTAQD